MVSVPYHQEEAEPHEVACGKQKPGVQLEGSAEPFTLSAVSSSSEPWALMQAASHRLLHFCTPPYGGLQTKKGEWP